MDFSYARLMLSPDWPATHKCAICSTDAMLAVMEDDGPTL